MINRAVEAKNKFGKMMCAAAVLTTYKDEAGNDLPKTVISREYSSEWTPGGEPYYPVNDEKNSALLKAYQALAAKENVLFGGRLGEYRYYDMDQVIARALNAAADEI